MINHNDFIKIDLDYDIKITAREMTNKLLQVIKDKKGSLFNTDEEQNRYYGFLGELAIQKFFSENNIYFITDDVIGKSDKYDILINNKKIDVKTASRKNNIKELFNDNYDFFIAEQQVNNNHADYYVQVIINKEYAYIIGFIDNKKVKDYPLKKTVNMVNTAYSIPINELFSMNELLIKLRGKNGQTKRIIH